VRSRNIARVNIFNVPVDVISEDEVLEKITTFLTSSTPRYIVTLNSLILEEALRDNKLAEIIKNADVVIPDSAGIVFAIRLLYGIKVKRLAGIDVMYGLLSIAERLSKSIYLLGSKREVVESAANNIKLMFPGIIIKGYSDGYYPIDNEGGVVSEITRLSPDVVLVCLGMVRQEKFIDKYKDRINAKVYIGLGGSFDVISGHLSRAPMVLRKLSLEWLYRTCVEPWRIKRVARLVIFAFRVVKFVIVKAFAKRGK
jgi:N-acetylglucosaminyldiphosphoundecaprenol N-acetyl-beta-D-mannosaminyltransferase